MHTPIAVVVAMAARSVLAVAVAVEADAPPAPPQITPFAGANDPLPRLNVWLDSPNLTPINSLESACLENTLVSLIFDSPPMTDNALCNWAVETAYAQVKTVTDISEVDDMCVTTDDLTPPATLASVYTAYREEYRSWQVEHQEEVRSIAEKCGPRVGPVFLALVATDEEERKTAVSMLFGATPGVTTTAEARATATATVGGTGTGSLARETATATDAGKEASENNVKGPESGAAGRGVSAVFLGAVIALAGVAGLFVGL